MTARYFLVREHFDQLIHTLQSCGFSCSGPLLRDGAILYDNISSSAEFPVGVTVQQKPGSYSVERTESARFFSWSNGPQALKPLTFTPRELLWQAHLSSTGDVEFESSLQHQHPLAVFGVKACDLAALELQDKHFLGNISDPFYHARRETLFLIGVNCSHPSETCFCASTGDGPSATSGYDLLLDELDDGFIIQSGSEAGTGILNALNLPPATPTQIDTANSATALAAASQTRVLPEGNLAPMLFSQLDNPQWKAIAERCLSCGNCTSVCPSCFCHNETEIPSLDGKTSDHYREWDSCFTEGHSYTHGFVIRPDTANRYRQWLTHKLGSWHKQYGRSGCTGCGRCISWCPVGIDLTEEVNVLANA